MWLASAQTYVYTVIDLIWVLLYGTPPSPHQSATTSTLTPGLSEQTTPVVASYAEPIIEMKRSPSPLWALVIGINDYQLPRTKTLYGAVPGADAMANYLEKDLNVPPGQITNLRDSQATRAAIIRELHALAINPNIRSDDPILIYFAGHGCTAPVPEGWQTDGSLIEMICPHDQGCELYGKDVNGIPDRTIGVLISKIAEKKENNITVIFDCCHSGSGTRIGAPVDPTRLERSLNLRNIQIPSNIDQDILADAVNDRATATPTGFLKKGLRSHVLLAACNEHESAMERNSRGIFTVALLDTLQDVGAHKLTYRDAIQRLGTLEGQNPQCEGFHQGRILFNAKAPSNNRVLYPVHSSKGNQYIVDAGAAHGIADGAEFAVFKTKETAELLGTLKVVMIKPFSTTAEVTCGSPFDVGEEAFALQTRAGEGEDLCLHIPLDDKLMNVFKALANEMVQKGPAQRKIKFVEGEEKKYAQLDIAFEGGDIVFNIMDKSVIRYGLTRMPFRVKPTEEEVYPVIQAAAHYHWHLRRTSSLEILRKMVSIEFYKLEQTGEYYEDLAPIVVQDGENLVCDNVVNIFVDKDKDEDAMYGVKILNYSVVDLYPSLFLFDNSDLSIKPYYEPPTSNQEVKAPLKAKDATGPGSLTIGYGGNSGSAPFSYYLRPKQDIDVSYLKLFLSTKQVDLSSVSQKTPFTEPGEHRSTFINKPKPMVTWDTIILPIIQRAAK